MNLTILEEAFEEHVKRKVSVVDFKIVVTVNIVYVAENGGDQTVEVVGKLQMAFEFVLFPFLINELTRRFIRL